MSTSIDEILSSGATLDRVVRHWAATSPAAGAYTWHSFVAKEATETLSYGALDAKARAIAHRIARHAGQPVLLVFPPGPEFLCGFLGCLYANVIAVAADMPRRRARWGRMESIVRDAEPVLLLSTRSAIDSLFGQALPEDGWLTKLPILAVDEVAPDATCPQLPASSPESIAFLQYTSGSTSSPKGVMVTHRNVLATMLDMQRGWRHDAASVMVTWLPTFHDMGLIYGALMPVIAGFPCHAMSPAAFMQEPLRWLQTISKVRGTHSAAANFAYQLCVDKIPSERRQGLDLSSWRVAVNGAEPVLPETLESFSRQFAECGFRGEAIKPGYGLAECSLKVTSCRANEPPRIMNVLEAELKRGRAVPGPESAPGIRRLVSCGKGEIGADIQIVGTADGLARGDGEVGEIWISSEAVAAGYWNRQNDSAATFQAVLDRGSRTRYLRTGDLGFTLEGELYIVGRIKDLIVVHGLNIYPQDIENTVTACHPEFRGGTAAAFGIPGSRGGEGIAVVQEVARTGLRRVDAPALTAAVRTAVWDAHEVQLDAIVLVKPGTLPKTSSGKLQRSACRQRFFSEALAEVGRWDRNAPTNAAAAPSPVAPSAIEAWSREWIARQTGIPREQIHSDIPFADLGLTSLEAVRFASELFDYLGRNDARDTLLWEYPTIRAICDAFAPARVTDQSLENLSEDELRQLLLAELQSRDQS